MNRIGAWCQFLHHKSVLEYEELAREGKLNDLYVLLHHAGDADPVQANLDHFDQYYNALSPLGVNFYAWIWNGEDPGVDARAAQRLLRDHPLDGIIANAEVNYANDGFRRSQTFLGILGPMARGTLGLSTEATPAYRMYFDFRSWEIAGADYLPQCYWNEFAHAEPAYMVKQAYLPDIVHVGWNYRLWIRGQSPRWGLVTDLYKDHIRIRDLRSRVMYSTSITIDQNGSVWLGDRVLRTRTVDNAGKILGFFPRSRIHPVVGTYAAPGQPRLLPSEIEEKMTEAKVAKGSLYLGEISMKADFEAMNNALR